MTTRRRSILDSLEEVEQVQQAAAAYLMEEEESEEIVEGEDDGVMLFDETGAEDDDFGEDEQADVGEDDVIDPQALEGFVDVRRSNRAAQPFLQPLYEEEEEESEPFHSSNDDGEHVSSGDSGQFQESRQSRRQMQSLGSQRSIRSGSPATEPEEISSSLDSGSKPSLGSRQSSITNIFGARSGGRRQGNLRASFRSTGSSASGVSEESVSSEPSPSGPRRTSIIIRQFPRLSTRRNPARRADSAGSDTSDFDAAVEKFNSNNSEWEQSAAAAAVVASRKGHSVQYSQGEHVLVHLTLLNYRILQMVNQPGSDMDEERLQQIKDSISLAPVNKLGYPEGEGRTEAERAGPFLFVLCSVRQVHFDEDERYYTVIRGDTGTEQRAEAAWMQPITNEAAIQVALRAARRTKLSLAEDEAAQDGRRRINALENWTIASSKWLQAVYKKNRLRAKILVRKVLLGETGYAFKIRLTGINFLVLCSFSFLFLDVIDLAFLSPDADRAIAIVDFVVWFILVMELLLEFLIRPPDYSALMQSEKAFAPSTARHINVFHLVMESFALILFAPRFRCVANEDNCGTRGVIGPGLRASIDALSGDNEGLIALGRFFLGLHFLRTFGLIRHWKQVWLKSTFEDDQANSQIIRRLLLVETDGEHADRQYRRAKKTDLEKALDREEDRSGGTSKSASEEQERLKNAATIGTALMVVNSHRFLLLMLLGVSCYPIIYTFGYRNNLDRSLGELLSSYNTLSNSTADCEYLQYAVRSWLGAAATSSRRESYLLTTEKTDFLLWAQILPVRCSWQRDDGVITMCGPRDFQIPACDVWDKTKDLIEPSDEDIADELGKRAGALATFRRTDLEFADFNATEEPVEFRTTAVFDLSHVIEFTNRGLFYLLVALLTLCLVGLTMLRGDARRLVLHPLQRMLKIVIRYAENPLSQSLSGQQAKSGNEGSDDTDDNDKKADQLGNFETEQLINAIARIADLLRKCWGVAGAGIISSNLAREDGQNAVFNPTVPGKRVYALFGFVAINNFDKVLRALEQDTLTLINDVAKVVHDEVFRWALGDSGQCNKNLGGSFLMVFRIGTFREVHARRKQAQDVVFENRQRRYIKGRRRAAGRSRGKRDYGSRMDMGRDETLQLASLPGIQTFTDRALLGFLKSFAGLNRDYEIQKWRKDFRLGAGVGAFSVSVMYGMDAGWAVEGAVGSEYKIDATYLSPHVNMASRMMSATKQYGVTILLSHAVEKLLSTAARSKLRHLDTVTVKGSDVAQQIFTFDARHERVEFFLFERTPDQADAEAEAYTPAVWGNDQDLNAMRQHVSDEFMKKFKEGVDLYLDGKWKTAVEKLKDADDIMIETVLESGYVDFDDIDDLDQILNRNNRSEEVQRARNEIGDGACKCLIQYMQRRDCIPPDDWQSVRALMSK